MRIAWSQVALADINRILYLVQPEVVSILTVIHDSRDLGGRSVKPWDSV